MKNQSKRLIFVVGLGFLLFAVSTIIFRTPSGRMGFPANFGFPSLACPNPSQPLIGCGYAYDATLLAFDILIWVAIAFGLAAIGSIVYRPTSVEVGKTNRLTLRD